MDKIVIFGADGRTGVCAVQAAVKKGYNVRAFVRDPAKLPDDLRNSVEVVKGDVLEYNDVLNACKDVTGVVVVLGYSNALKPPTLFIDGTRNIVKAMKELGVEIISICLSRLVVCEPGKAPRRILRDLNCQLQLDLLEESGLKYVAILPPEIVDKPSGDYEVKIDDFPEREISKHDLGRFLIESLTQPEYHANICGICSKQK